MKIFDSIKRILVVDDEPEFVKTIKRHLRREGFSLDSACDGEEAKEKIDDSVLKCVPFDLIVADLVMPAMGGIELLEWVKKTHPEMSVLLVSGFGDNSTVMEKIRKGMDDFAEKPLTPKDMIGFIGEINNKRRRYLSIIEK